MYLFLLQSIPKKPPRQKRSPVPVRRSPNTTIPDIPSPIPPPLPQKETSEHISQQNMDIPTAHSDNLKIEPTQDANQCKDQSHSSSFMPDQEDTSKSHSEIQGPPIANKPKLSPKPTLPRRPTIPKSKEDDSVDPVTGKQVKQPFYMEMTGKKSDQPLVSRPVSEVKPNVKGFANENNKANTNLKSTQPNSASVELKPSHPKEDNYGMLFQNLKKDPKKTQSKPDFRRTNTAPEDTEYVGPYPVSPSEKFKEKHGLLRRTNTAPEETYVAMDNPKKKEKTDEEEARENEYSEIPEKEGLPSSPNDNVYATISETKQAAEPEVTEYSKISEITPPISPTQDRDMKG